jgi:hypothetical protein
MRIGTKLIIFLILLAYYSFIANGANVTNGDGTLKLAQETHLFDDSQMLQPADLFQDFPEINWDMSWAETYMAIEKMGFNPIAFKKTQTELAWNGKFGGMDGRGTVLFKENGRMYEIAVIIYALDKRKEMFEQLKMKIEKKHGAAKEGQDTSIATSKVWKLKNGYIIELRLIKDDDSPVIDIHWVKS